VEIRGDKVRLGVEAPKEVPVHRREVYEAIRRIEQQEKSGEAESREQEKGGDPESEAQEQGGEPETKERAGDD